MDLFGGVRSLQTAMDYHLDRQVFLNGNIANGNTPGYRPVDLGLLPDETQAPVEPAGVGAGDVALASLHGLGLSRTAPGHLDPARRPALLVPFEDPAQSAGNDLNFVDMDRELAKAGANALRYETAAELMARRLSGLRYAASDGQGA